MIPVTLPSCPSTAVVEPAHETEAPILNLGVHSTRGASVAEEALSVAIIAIRPRNQRAAGAARPGPISELLPPAGV